MYNRLKTPGKYLLVYPELSPVVTLLKTEVRRKQRQKQRR